MELRVAESAHFVTLSYAPEKVPLVKEYGVWMTTLRMKDVQDYMKRLRMRIMDTEIPGERFLKEGKPKVGYTQICGRKVEYLESTYSPKLRYMVAGEYGPLTSRAHYHILQFNTPIHYFEDDPIHNEIYSPELEKIWNNGNIKIGEVTQARAHYMSKHNVVCLIEKWDDDSLREKPFSIMSTKPGIGYNYTKDEKVRDYFNRTENNFTNLKSGYTQPIGRYLSEKIWPDEEDENGFSVRNKHRENATKKAIKHGKEQEKKEFEQAVEQFDGDIIAAERYIHQARLDQERNLIEKAKRNIKKGRKL